MELERPRRADGEGVEEVRREAGDEGTRGEWEGDSCPGKWKFRLKRDD